MYCLKLMFFTYSSLTECVHLSVPHPYMTGHTSALRLCRRELDSKTVPALVDIRLLPSCMAGMGNNLLYLPQNAKNAHTPLFPRSDGQQPPTLDTHCKERTHFVLPAALMGRSNGQ